MAGKGKLVVEKLRAVEVGQGSAGLVLVDFLAERLGCSRRQAKVLIDGRRVFVNGRRLWMAKHHLRRGDKVEFPLGERGAARPDRSLEIEILYRDESLLAVNKPARILTQGKGSLEQLLRDRFECPGLEAIHRLDRDTSGVLLFAFRADMRARMVELFRAGAIEKDYFAIVYGRYGKTKQTIMNRIEGKSAITHVQVISANRQASLLRCRIETGRTHQVRKHLAAVGNPVAGDKQYGVKILKDAVLRGIPRQMLHAIRVEFVHPDSAVRLVCRAEPPSDFLSVLKQLNLKF